MGVPMGTPYSKFDGTAIGCTNGHTYPFREAVLRPMCERVLAFNKIFFGPFLLDDFFNNDPRQLEFQLVQAISQQFWKVWIRLYLSTFCFFRHKWHTKMRGAHQYESFIRSELRPSHGCALMRHVSRLLLLLTDQEQCIPCYM